MEVASHTGERREEGTGARGGVGVALTGRRHRAGRPGELTPREKGRAERRADRVPAGAGQRGRAARGPPRARSGAGASGASRPPAGRCRLALAVLRSLPRRAGPPVCGVCRLCVCVLLGMQKKKKKRKTREKKIKKPAAAHTGFFGERGARREPSLT